MTTRDSLYVRRHGVPLAILRDAKTNEPRCINGLHIETFVRNPFGDGTLITFVSGDRVTVTDDFDAVVDTFMSDSTNG